MAQWFDGLTQNFAPMVRESVSPSRRFWLKCLGIVAACGLIACLTGARQTTLEACQTTPDFPNHALTRALVRWDAGWYAEIAQNGYFLKPGAQSPVAFFPLYPGTISLLKSLGFNRYLAGVLLTLSFGLMALGMFRKWARFFGDDVMAQRAVWLLMLYPFAFYLYGVMYSDALFLLLVVSAFWAVEARRLFWVVALGALATAARPVAPAVVLGLGVRWLELRHREKQPFRVRDLAPLLSGAGLGAYMLFLHTQFGDALAFAHTQGAPGWEHVMGWESWLKWPLWKELARRPLEWTMWLRPFHGLLALGGLLLAWPTARRLGWGYGVYVAVVIGIPFVSSKDFHGLGRYLLAAFPVFLTWTQLLVHNPLWYRIILALSALGGSVLFWQFSKGTYVA